MLCGGVVKLQDTIQPRSPGICGLRGNGPENRLERPNRAGTTMGEQSVSAVIFWRGSGGWGRGEVCPGVVGLKPNRGNKMDKQ